jgi:hypothetical protein
MVGMPKFAISGCAKKLQKTEHYNKIEIHSKDLIHIEYKKRSAVHFESLISLVDIFPAFYCYF